MKEFLKKVFSGLIQFVKDTQQLIGYRKKEKYIKQRNDNIHAQYERNLGKYHNIHKGERCFIIGNRTKPSVGGCGIIEGRVDIRSELLHYHV